LKPKPQNAADPKIALHCMLFGTICLIKQLANLFWALANDLSHGSKLKADILNIRLIKTDACHSLLANWNRCNITAFVSQCWKFIQS